MSDFEMDCMCTIAFLGSQMLLRHLLVEKKKACLWRRSVFLKEPEWLCRLQFDLLEWNEEAVSAHVCTLCIVGSVR